VNASRVTLRTGDTAFVKAGGGTHSDRSMRIGGTLLVRGSAQIVEKCKSVVAQLLQCPIKDVDFLAGTFSHGGRIFSLADISTHVAAHGLPDEASVRVINAEVDFVGRMSAHPTGSAVCELEVDPETGDVELLHYTSVDDVGRVINPLIVEGQVHGGLAQGIGQALSEGYFVDAVSGQVLSGSYMDYGVPRAGAIPRLSLEFTEDPTLGNPLGVKGGGESGITPATAAIFNALSNALTDYRKDRELGMPATSEVVWQFIHCASHL
jgi:carbon-monoxide dehydrogenase large subunit